VAVLPGLGRLRQEDFKFKANLSMHREIPSYKKERKERKGGREEGRKEGRKKRRKEGRKEGENEGAILLVHLRYCKIYIKYFLYFV
jgi:predicted transposase YdaD